MDWDEKPKQVKQAILGEPLHDLSVAELGERIDALKAEIARVEDEMRAKQAQGAAAADLFKS